MVRFLVYSNEYDVEGLIATTSVWLRDKVAPNKILERIDAYAEVQSQPLAPRPRLPHSCSCPEVAPLRPGRIGMRGVGPGKQSDGSQLIIAAATREDPRPLHISVWAAPTPGPGPLRCQSHTAPCPARNPHRQLPRLHHL